MWVGKELSSVPDNMTMGDFKKNTEKDPEERSEESEGG